MDTLDALPKILEYLDCNISGNYKKILHTLEHDATGESRVIAYGFKHTNHEIRLLADSKFTVYFFRDTEALREWADNFFNFLQK